MCCCKAGFAGIAGIIDWKLPSLSTARTLGRRLIAVGIRRYMAVAIKLVYELAGCNEVR